ncbi:low molecular weight protein-tyrosine-phosphatase [Sungkyunkwania multivorans]|uniref:protein-tyrosine-phosphatase n=1 Tax=Sungkyunkwania multivorans TaxID=1173618 RepID=A0ABW3CVV7_9FLAO
MKTKILMVCLGNICRSPLAEGILASKLDPDRFYVDSAGTAGYHVGNLPDARSIAVAKRYGLDITYQRSRKLTKEDLEEFDHIFAMDNSNYHDIIALADSDEERAKVDRILNLVFPDENVDVPDPYYGGDQGFENVYKMLDEACEALSKRLQ